MTEQRKNRQALRALSAERHDYAVGYGKPPAAHRFRKGQSGNPKGRPRGARNKQPALSGERLTAIILDEAYRGIDIRDGDRRLTVPMAQAVMRSIAHNAVKGRHFSQKLFAELVADVEQRKAAQNLEFFQEAYTYKEFWEGELGRRQRHGITHLPDPVPHPDHIHLDVRTGQVKIAGPMSKDEKLAYEQGARTWAWHDEEVRMFEDWIRNTACEDRKQRLRETVAIMRKTHALLDEALPPDMKKAALRQAREQREEEENDGSNGDE